MLDRRAVAATLISLSFFAHCGNVTISKPARAEAERHDTKAASATAVPMPESAGAKPP